MWDQLQYYSKVAEPYVNQGYAELLKVQHEAEKQIYTLYPEAKNFNHFQSFLVLNAVLLALVILWRVILAFNPVAIYRKAVKLTFKLPFVANKLKAEIAKSK